MFEWKGIYIMDSRDLYDDRKEYSLETGCAIAAPVIEPHILNEDVIVYSGMYTTTKQEQIEKISNIYASADFAKYCSIIGKDMSGGYISISTKMVKQFGIG